MNFNKMTTAKLKTLAVELAGNLESNYVNLCKISIELKKRNEAAKWMNHGIFRWAAEIVDGVLHPSAVIAFSSVTLVHVSKLIGMPLELQKRLADGEKIPLATYDSFGNFRQESRSMHEMRAREVDMAIKDGSIVSFKEQCELLDMMPVSPYSKIPLVMIKLDHKTSELIFGEYRVSASRVAFAMAKLGFTLVREDHRSYQAKQARKAR